MLARISGGSSGIKEYLEEGQKQGRLYTRDELDERVILDGDLSLTDSIINNMDTNGERYFHITLAFKEDEISREIIEAVIQDFKAFAFSAFNEDEYSFYAEAHLPKIKSYTSKKTGEFVERKPHIHIVIPETNLLSGNQLRPFGNIKHQEKYLESFQETINNKYGLASPKDNRRTSFNLESEIVSRYKGDEFEGRKVFTGHHKELKAKILSDILEKGIHNQNEFSSLLASYGEVKVRNAGKHNEYLNIKPDPSEKGVNLKEFVFSRDFLSLPDDQKRQELAKVARAQYETTGPARATPAKYEATLKDWHDRRAKEIKYLNSGNQKEYKAYQSATPDKKAAILAEKERKFYEKHNSENFNGYTRTDYIRDNLRAVSDNLEAAGRHAYAVKHTPGDFDQARRNVADRRNRGIGGTAIERADRQAAIESDRGAKSRKTSVTGQLRDDKKAATEQQRGNQEFAEIKRTLDAKRLLARLSHTHGVNPDKYEVSQGQDGGDRIKAGTRNLNVSDFLTKELHLNYRVAGQILREDYREQTGQEPRLNPKQQARADLWNDYQGARKIKDRERKQETERGRETMQAKRQAIKQETGRKLAAIRSNRSLTPAERKAALSIARMEKVQAEEALREKAKAESDRRAAAKAEEYKNGYRNYLAERAQAGDEVALAELRRQRERKPEPTGPNVIERGDRDQEEETERALIMRKLAYSIDRAGNVTYYADQSKHKALIVDAGNRVTVTADKDAQAVEAGLKLAIQKFGQHLTIEGNEAFKQQVIETVIKTGLHVSFDDKQMNDELQLRRAEREELRARGRAFIEAEKRRQLEVEPPINQPQPESHQQQQEKTEPEPEQTRSNEIER
jgi:hypothetical protein